MRKLLIQNIDSNVKDQRRMPELILRYICYQTNNIEEGLEKQFWRIAWKFVDNHS